LPLIVSSLRENEHNAHWQDEEKINGLTVDLSEKPIVS